MNGALETLLQYLSAELATLMKSGDNWQIVLHGGRHGDVKAEVKRVRQVTTPRSLQAQPAVVDQFNCDWRLLFSRENVQEWVMQEVYRVVWRDLSKKGRAVVLVVLLLAVAGLLAMAMWLRYDLTWVPGLLGQG